jgi:excinuclease ABC subunit C
MFHWKIFLSYVTQKAGIYMMFDEANQILYIGKAKNLKKRLTSYSKDSDNPKTQKLVEKIARIETVVTNNEVEALLLEQNFIKQYKPPYNILLRDDKTYPYIEVSYGDYPKISYLRGKKKEGSYYFGPFVDTEAVKESIKLLQKLFHIRTCTDSYFKNRSRPCLQYQIQNCTAPCTDLISKEQYQENVDLAKMFLSGDNSKVQATLKEQMLSYAENYDFEKAATLRDTLQKINKIQTPQMSNSGADNVDVFYIMQVGKFSCVNFAMIRQGKIIGATNITPSYVDVENADEVLFAVLSHYYLSDINNLPSQIIVNLENPQYKVLSEAIASLHNVKIEITADKNNQYLTFAKENVENYLHSYINKTDTITKRWKALQEALNLPTLTRMECFDISHLQGEATVASNVVFDENGPNKRLYRHYKITDITPGDDYAAIYQALFKRFKKKENLPELLIVDGGTGQMQMAIDVLRELEINITLLAVAKGVERKPGLETIYLNMPDNIVDLAEDAFYLIQHIRDESHSYAVSQHIKARSKKRKTSILENIPGIGAGKRQELLLHFGGLQQIKEASINQLMNVKGISENIARDIYYYFHSENIIHTG